MALIIKRIELKDFISHKSTRIELGEGIIALVGENGAGKSSIVDAVYMGLSVADRSPRGSTLSELIRHGTASARISIELSGDTNARIEIELTRNGKSVKVIENGRVTSVQVKGSRERIASILGVKAGKLDEIVGKMLVVRQGTLDSIMTDVLMGSKGKKEDFISNLLGLKDFEKASDKMKDEYEIVVKGDLITGGMLKIRPTERSIADAEFALKDLKKRVKLLKEEIPRIEARIQDYTIEKRSLEEESHRLEEELRALNNRIAEVKSKISEESRLREKLGETLSEIANLEKRLRESIKAAEELPRVEKLAKMENLVKELETRENEIKRLREELERLSKLEEALATIKALDGAEEEYRRLEEEARSVKEALASVKEKKAAIVSQASSLERHAKQLEKISSSLASLGFSLEAGASREQVLKLQSKLKGEKSKVEGDLVSVKASIKAAKQRVLELKSYIEKVSREEYNQCPVCGRPLSGPHKERVLRILKERIEESMREASSLQREAEKAEARLRVLGKALELLDSYMGVISGYSKHPASILGEFREELARINVEERKLEDELSALEKKLEEARSRHHKLIEALGILKGYDYSVEELDRLEDDIKRRKGVEEELEKAELALSKAKEKLVLETGKQSIGEALEEIRKASRLVELLREQASRAEEYSILIERRKQDEAEIRVKLGEIKSLKNRLQLLEEERRGLEARLEHARKRLKTVYEELGRLKRMLEEKKETLSKATPLIGDIEASIEKAKVALAIRKLLEEAPRVLREAFLRHVERVMSEVLSKFNLEYTSVYINPGTLEFYAITNMGERRSISQLSGGERTVIALAFILAVNSALVTKAGFLILDEPTSNLDEARRRALIDLLSSSKEGLMNWLRQLIIISHHEDVIDAADSYFRVYKAQGVSRVEPG